MREVVELKVREVLIMVVRGSYDEGDGGGGDEDERVGGNAKPLHISILCIFIYAE